MCTKKENLKCNTIIDKSRWPGSFLEFNKVIGPLTNPKQYGLDDSICFDLVMPSIQVLSFLVLLSIHMDQEK